VTTASDLHDMLVMDLQRSGPEIHDVELVAVSTLPHNRLTWEGQFALAIHTYESAELLVEARKQRMVDDARCR